MVNPTYPGVYIVEEPSAVHTITAVATSIAAFFGRTRQGPVNKAIRIHSLSDFYKIFGLPFQDSDVSYSCQLFFQNGGTDCYVVRLIKDNGMNASIVLKNESKDYDVLEFTAKEPGISGNELTLQVDYDTPLPEDTFNLRVYRITGVGTIVASEEFLNCSMDPDSPRFTPKLITQSSDLVNCALKIDPAEIVKKPSYSESRYPIPDSATSNWRDNLVTILSDQGSKTTSKFQISIEEDYFFEIDLKGAINSSMDDVQVQTSINNKINELFHLH